MARNTGPNVPAPLWSGTILELCGFLALRYIVRNGKEYDKKRRTRRYTQCTTIDVLCARLSILRLVIDKQCHHSTLLHVMNPNGNEWDFNTHSLELDVTSPAPFSDYPQAVQFWFKGRGSMASKWDGLKSDEYLKCIGHLFKMMSWMHGFLTETGFTTFIIGSKKNCRKRCSYTVFLIPYHIVAAQFTSNELTSSRTWV